MKLPAVMNISRKEGTLVTCQGSRNVFVEDFRQLLAVNNSRILILTEKAKLQISGKKLVIQHYNKDEMKISGNIEKIEWHQR